jgi:nicotinate-nucleotide adenylyltransferase
MIGIFGGTFDPVHYGHIKPVLAVKKSLNLSQIRFIPNRVPPHRSAPWLTAEQRLSLLAEALKGYPDVVIDQREFKRTGASYMVDTLSSLKEDFPGETFVLIIGMDVFYDITTWHRWKSLFDLCHLVVTTRPGFQQSGLVEHMAEHFSVHVDEKDCQYLAGRMTDDITEVMRHEAGKILLKSVPQVDVSATQIRESILAGDWDESSIDEMMPRSAYQKLRGFINDN